MINLENLTATEAEALAYAEGFTGTARQFARIDNLEAERDMLQEQAKGLIPVRYFIIDYDLEDGPDVVEVDEYDFEQAKGRISYKRNTIRENGCNQICLTKGFED